jgi:UDP-glucose 4-epimerase
MEWHACDVNLENLLVYAGTPGVIVHCAGSGSVGFSMTHPARDFLRTVETTLAVLEFIRLHSPRTRLVFPSSAAVYGASSLLPSSVRGSLNPVSPYGVHKKLAEELCCSYGRHFGVAGAIIRFFSLYGPELRKQLLWDAANKLHRRDLLFQGTGRETRDLIHARDGARLVFIAAGKAGPEFPIVNGGSGSSLEVREILLEVFRELKSPQPPRFSGEARPGDPTGYLADISEALAWGWKPLEGWKDGIREYIDWYQREVA